MKQKKNLALVAHDNRKKDMKEWVEWNRNILLDHNITCTGTTGRMIEEVLNNRKNKNRPEQKATLVKKLKSGPLGGDQQLGALIASGKIDILIFFWDPMEPQPHDVDVKALLRIAVVYNIPIANNRSSADFIISSSLIDKPYEPTLKDYSNYTRRPVL